MRNRLWLVVVALFACSFVWSLGSAPAFAQESGPAAGQSAEGESAKGEPTSGESDKKQELTQLVREASAAYADGDYETAVDKLLMAYRLEPNARLLYNTARSYEELCQCRLALVYYRSFTQHEGAEETLAKNASEKLSDADACEEFSPTLIGRLVVISEPSGATVSIDGREVGTTPTEIAGISSGEYEVSVELDGYTPAKNTLTLAAGRDREVRAKLVEASAQEVSSEDLIGEGGGSGAGVGEPGASSESGGLGSNIPAVALIGAGLVGVGVGTYFDLVAIPNTDEERSAYAADSQEFADLTDTRSDQATAALVGYIGGGALLAAGATWLILDLTGTTSDEESALRPITSPRKGGFVAGVEWQF